MKYNLKFVFSPPHATKFIEIFESEVGKKDRSEITIKKKGEKVYFDIKASDLTALKAAANLIIKMLQIYEKTIELK